MASTELNTERNDTLEISGSKRTHNSVRQSYQEELIKSRRLFFEEYLKIILGIILVLLFIALFIGIVWYFLIQLDATLFDKLMGDTEAVSSSATGCGILPRLIL